MCIFVTLSYVMENVKDKKIYVGLSGGVDSSVSVALLLHAGAKVTGVFIKGWYPPGLPCTWASDRIDAMRVAARLGIPFYTLDASAQYKKNVIDYLIAEYAVGRTPNPDVFCNRDIKFGVFARDAFKRGADYIATGHYARLHRGADADVTLLRGIDEKKDQSYFLWAVSPEVFSRTLFPIGEYRKPDVRKLAREFNIPVAQKRDSQGICFLGPVSVDEFLRLEFGTEIGRALDTHGNEIGTHDGVVLHTIGQKIALNTSVAGPWYVVAKNFDRNEIVVSHNVSQSTPRPAKPTASRGGATISLLNTNWFVNPLQAHFAQYRYHGPIIPGAMEIKKGEYFFVLNNPLPEVIADGQSLVLYRGAQCLGGGILQLCNAYTQKK